LKQISFSTIEGKVTMTKNSESYIKLEDEFGANNYHPLDIVIERAEGIWVWDVDNNKYMDCLSAYSAVNQGHCHKRLVSVMQEQCAKLTLTSRAFRNNHLGAFYKAVCQISGKNMVLPMNTGAEAVETAIKAARKWGYKKKGISEGKAEIIVFQDNFHGRTTTIVGFSTEEQYKDGFGPFTPGFKVIPFGDAKALEAAINENTCAFLFEAIQGEAGIHIPPDGFLKKARELCTKNNVMMIADEIQTGLGRTGKWFASEHFGIVPDMYIMGKALAGGFYPVSAVAADKEILDVFNPGDHGSTFGGNPLGAALAVEALAILKEEKLVENSANIGNYFMDKLKAIDLPIVTEIRGKGLLIGLELDRKARPYCEALMAKGLLCKETHDNVIRFAPPLTISLPEVDWALERIEAVLKEKF
jgi:ornithine--oxo-acid transaminase